MSFSFPNSPFLLQNGDFVLIVPSFTSPDPSGIHHFSIQPVIYTESADPPADNPQFITFYTKYGILKGPSSFSSISAPIDYTVTARTALNAPLGSAVFRLAINFIPEFFYPDTPYILHINDTLIPPPPPPLPPISNSIITPTYVISNLSNIIYSIVTPANGLPNGLILNPSNGSIYGRPTSAIIPTSYTIRAYNYGVIYDTTLNISVQASPTVSYPNQNYTLTQGQPITILPIPNLIDVQVTYSISGCALPLGMSFNAQTGAITGIPTVLMAQRDYTVVITNTVGIGSTKIILNVIKIFLTTPVVADNFSSNSFLTNPDTQMRRKAEILQYKKNSSTITKNQYLSMLAKGSGPWAKRAWGNQGDASTNPNISNLAQNGNTLVCNTNPILCAPTSSSDVPGNIINLCYNPAIPLIGYNAPNRTKISVGFKWPQQAWRVGDTGFPVGKAGNGAG